MHTHKDKPYKLKIGREVYQVESSEITGAGILALAGKPLEGSVIYQKLNDGGRTVVSKESVVDLSDPGIEKFVIIPIDQTEGYASRRDFSLPANDSVSLDSLGFRWDAVIENGTRRVIIYGYPVCDGYNHEAVDLNLRIGTNYPDEQIDMVYFYPALQRKDGRAIGALASDSFDGKVWQRWSRHRTPQNPWKPGEDDISTHLVCVDEWLKRELRK